MGNRSLFSVAPCRLLSLVLSFAPKESTIPRRGGSPIVRAAVGASDPTGRRSAPAGASKGFPRGKQSARFALPCAPLVVCLNSGSLTAFGGCAHWARASLCSPLETLGPRRLAKLSHGAANPATRAAVGASNPHRQKRACTCGRTKGLSSGQTIGAVRTAVRSACCLPELRVANRLRRLCPLGTRFPLFPFGNPRAPKVGKAFPWSCKPRHPRRSRRVKPSSAKEGLHLRAHQRAFLGANNRRGSHCRALRLLFA